MEENGGTRPTGVLVIPQPSTINISTNLLVAVMFQ